MRSKDIVRIRRRDRCSRGTSGVGEGPGGKGRWKLEGGGEEVKTRGDRREEEGRGKEGV